MNFRKCLTALALIAAAGSPAMAQIPVLVEPLNPSGAGGSKPQLVRGILLSPDQVFLKAPDGSKPGQPVHLDKVLAIHFPAERLAVIDREIDALKKKLEDPNFAKNKDVLLANLVELGKEKATLLTSGVKVVAHGESDVAHGHLDEGKGKVKFVIETKTAAQGESTATRRTYSSDQLKAIYFLPQETVAKLTRPFWQEPSVVLIGPHKECCKPEDACSLEKCVEEDKDKKLRSWSYRFKGAANFPQPRFGQDGDRHNIQGVVIYEGMQIVVASDGRYEVTFNALAPNVPVTLRLKLMVMTSCPEPICLTLPPISIVPEYREGEDLGQAYRLLPNNFQQNWTVRHIGYSPELSTAVVRSAGIWAANRDGVARFGSLPQAR